ncbi:MAG: hypothetical protein Q9220_001743 [cf. Caloplaca sp. 1 TL-2023]
MPPAQFLRLRPLLLSPPIARYLSTSHLRPSPQNPPPATSTSAAQPFSTPFTPSPQNTPIPETSSSIPSPSSSQQPKPPKSSLSAGTPLKGLAFLKNKEPPVAKEDSEYPDWLWGLVPGDGGKEGGEEGGKGGGDAFSKSAKQRRLAARLARNTSLDPSSSVISSPQTVPLHEQSIDLPAAHANRWGRNIDREAGEKARGAREELGRAMRGGRRKGIKEANFLRGMR